ncbi:monocarboxylate transporter 13-like [Tubulanus polymorphus]|uniref:monocarboxylate transporter 13-like n=1 Tax=Tubulanus polymorphus TaxID=672921 RepID=UPI003DA3F60D
MTTDNEFGDDFREPGRIEGYCLVLASVGILMILGGVFYSVGILIVEWAEYFDTGYEVVSWIGAGHGMCLILAPVAGVLVKKFGLRRCLVVSGILNGLSICCSALSTKLWLIYVLWIFSGMVHSFHNGPVIAYFLIRFRRYRSIASAFIMSSVSLGTIVFGVIINATIEVYTWRGAVLIIGALTLNLIPCSLVLRTWNKPLRNKDILIIQEKQNGTIMHSDDNTAQDQLVSDQNNDKTTEKTSSGCKNMLDVEILRQPTFIGVIFPVFFLYVGVSIIFVHIVSGFADICKLDLESARYLVPYLGASNTVSRFIVSIISQHPRIDTFTLFLIVNVLLSVTVALIPVFEGFTAAVVLVVIIGIGLSAFSGLTHLVVADIIEYRYLHMAVQYMLLPSGVGYMVGAPLAGWLYDATGNYIYSFELTAGLVAVSVLVMIPFWIKHIRSLTSEKPSEIRRLRSAVSREWIASHMSLA